MKQSVKAGLGGLFEGILSGGQQGLHIGMDWEKMKQDAADRQQQLAQNQQALDRLQQESDERRKNFASDRFDINMNEFGKLMSTPDGSASAEDWLNTHGDRMKQFASTAGIPFNVDSLRANAKNRAPIVGNFFNVLDRAHNYMVEGNPYQLTPDDQNAIRAASAFYPEYVNSKVSQLLSANEDLTKQKKEKAGIAGLGVVSSEGQPINEPGAFEAAKHINLVGEPSKQFPGKFELGPKPAQGTISQLKLSDAQVKSFQEPDQLLELSSSLKELGDKPEIADKMFGISGGTVQAGVPVLGALKRQALTPDQSTFFKLQQQFRLEYEKAQGGVREVASQGMNKAIKNAVPTGRDTKPQFDTSLQAFTQLKQIQKAQVAANIIRSKAGSDPQMQSAVADRLNLDEQVKPLVVKILQNQKIEPSDFTGSATQTQQPPKQPVRQGPPVGSVVKGFRFKGGDPAKQESWEQVKPQQPPRNQGTQF